MSEPQPSPISQMLLSLGLTREDLMKETDNMRTFLNTQTAAILPADEALNGISSPSVADTRTTAKPPSISSSFTRSWSRASSNAFRESSPSPNTPVKSEPIEGGIPAPLRAFGSMEEVIERQRRQNRKGKKERRERERELQAKLNVPQAPSPSPGNAPQTGFKLDSPTKPRVETPFTPEFIQASAGGTFSQGDSTSGVPVTPQRNKYYREHTNLSSNTYPQPFKTPVKTESPNVTPVVQHPPSSYPQYLTYPQYLAYARLLPPLGFPRVHAGPSVLPITPQNQRTYKTKYENSPLPPSSPPPASSPVTTPSRPLVNLVSSPGPMGPLPDEEEYDKLPYTLPPGPYSPHKPDLSYAALVGQAILSSPEHRLTLQEIYDWITIVYPHFKRGETTWMNSIRHVLSTTICFRKVPRDRSVGRTLWAIWDEDLECFKGGGFRKHLCKDIAQSLAAKAEQSKGKGKSRKRAEGDDGTDSRKPKRAKREPVAAPAAPLATSYMPATLSAHPLFPPTRPTTHHQPYYESCMQPQTLPADVIFPPLPAGVGYNRLVSTVVESSTTAVEGDSQTSGDEASEVIPSPESTPIAGSDSAPSSLPDLTPNCSSSSPPPESSDLGTSSSCVDDVDLDEYITIGGDSDGEDDEEEAPAKDDEDNVFTQALLSPVKDWRQSPKVAEKFKAPEFTLGSGFKLELGTVHLSDDDEQPLWMRTKGVTRSPDGRKLNKKMTFPPIPTSPSLNRKASCHFGKVSKPLPSKKTLDGERPSTPTPSTPPRTGSQLPVSSVRTPLSSKGINPAALHSECDEEDTRDLEVNRTPRRRVVSSGIAPVTPRRLVFPTNQNESPFSTPAGGIFSPFRTPGSRSVFDPHDPGALLDEELNRMGGESPAGLFGKGRGSLLYDSPGLSSSGWW
ncbi:Forkhead box protein I1 [Termitomyces sp. J132]|nr:hypothetical protein H2248_010765 [Termitomyces sp. 'cryptogamus']KNZ74641.1 Forkhead box protein I1 [Termitomyces sp. J132]